MGSQQVSVIIPIYTNCFSTYERKSLAQCRMVLWNYPVILVKPEKLDLDDLLLDFPGVTAESFPDYYFRDRYGYNSLLLSPEFYKRFLCFDYVLIYQLDAYVFRDELKYWCERGFDYIGAPWTIKPKYNTLYYKIFLSLKSAFYKSMKKPFVLGRVGNGGFSLRRVDRFYEVSISKKKVIERYLMSLRQTGSCAFNEDVFWAMENPEFSYPSYSEAMRFSFDLYPEICYVEIEKTLPFGCHGWSKKKNIGFWERILSFITEETV